MNNLQKRIKRLEYEIHQEQVMLNQYYAALKQKIGSLEFISLTMLGSFTVGYVLVKTRARKMLYTFIDLPTLVWRMYANLKLLSN